MSQNFAKFQVFQLDNLVDFEKCCKTRIFLQKSVPVQPKTSNILPKFCQKLATTLRVHGAPSSVTAEPGAVRPAWPLAPPAPGRDDPVPQKLDNENAHASKHFWKSPGTR